MDLRRVVKEQQNPSLLMMFGVVDPKLIAKSKHYGFLFVYLFVYCCPSGKRTLILVMIFYKPDCQSS